MQVNYHNEVTQGGIVVFMMDIGKAALKKTGKVKGKLCVKIRVYGYAESTSNRTKKDTGMTQEASLPNTQWSCWLKALGEGLFYSCISCDTIKSNKLHENYKKHLGPLGVMHFKDSTVMCHRQGYVLRNALLGNFVVM